MNNGWIKLHRKIRDNPFYSNSNALALLIECLLRARHDTKEFYWKRERIHLKAGQFMFGDEELGKTFKIGKTTTRYWLEQFVVDRVIDIKRTAKGSIGTILNWKAYQIIDSTVGNQRETKGKPKDTNKKDKNVKNDKNNTFNQFYSAYPRKVQKSVALKSFIKLNPDKSLLQVILKDIERKKKSKQWLKDDGDFIQYPATYLNQKRWEDEETNKTDFLYDK